MDVVLILIAATILAVLVLVADRVGRDLSGDGGIADRADWPGVDDRPMRLDLLDRPPVGAERRGRQAARDGV